MDGKNEDILVQMALMLYGAEVSNDEIVFYI